MIFVHLKNLTVSFGGDTVLNDISYDFEQGRIYGIVGDNGSGKTVLMKCICVFISPDSGMVVVNGKRIGRDVDFAPDTGIIIETPGFLPNMTGYENLKILASINSKIKASSIKDSMRLVGLEPDSKKRVMEYSLGMRQRLGLAQALMEEPTLMILDEPFNGLDKNGAMEMHNILKGLRGERTIIFSSHNAFDIHELCDKVIVLEKGAIRNV